MKYYFTLALFIGYLIPVFAQNTVGIQLNDVNALNGYMLFSPRTSTDQKNTYLLNNCGEVVNVWSSNFPLFSTDYLMPDGSLFRSVVDNQSTLDIPGNTGRIEHLDWDNNLIWALTYSATDFSFHHDYVPLNNGNILMLVAHRKTSNDAIENGRDPSTLATDELYEERIIEIEPVGTDDFNIVWEWRSWDHLIQDFDNTKANFGVVEDHPELVDINFGISFGEADWWHANSISYSDERDQIIISNRNLNEFIIIDHSTSTEEAASSNGGNSDMGGDILYRWGNPQSYQQGDDNDRILYGQHDVQFIPTGLPNEGKIMIFNNGNDLTFTSIQIINPPYDATNSTYTYTGGAYGPEVPDWEYTDPMNPDNFHATFLSGSQQLENGNVLICHGPNGEVFEIDPSFNTVWRYQSPVANSEILSDGDDPSLSQTRIFRALKYPLDYGAFAGRDLTPQGPIEINAVEDNCTVLSVNDISHADLINVYPTITNDIIHINSSLADYKISLHSINGAKLDDYNNPTRIDLSHFSSGVYFAKLQTSSHTEIIRVIKR